MFLKAYDSSEPRRKSIETRKVSISSRKRRNSEFFASLLNLLECYPSFVDFVVNRQVLADGRDSDENGDDVKKKEGYHQLK